MGAFVFRSRRERIAIVKPAIRIALVDDQGLVREGIKALMALSGRVHVVLEARTGDELLARRGECDPDVIVMDIRMPGRDGLSTLAELRRRGDPVPVLILTTFHDNLLFDQAVAMGAQGFLRKDAKPETLMDAIARIHAGGTAFAPEPVDAERVDYPDDGGATIALSDRETSILRLMAGGYGNREIARTLFLAEGTVKNYVSELLSKLGARDRTQAVLKAITRRLI
jgi:DNA-binding NarL/FixJ family response regulator